MKLSNIAIILLFDLALGYAIQDAGYEQYKEAKEQTIAREWSSAISEFQQMIDEYPQSNYHDDALFWIGYSLEKIPGKSVEAFLAFENLRKTFPNSSWNDDAAIHQIDLAQTFIEQGQQEYRSFLTKQSQSEHETVRTKALTVLKELKERKLNENDEKSSDGDGQLSLSARYSSKIADRVEQQKEDDSFLFFPTERYSQYRKMLRNDNEWSKEELFDFGMWNILSEEQFSGYFALDGFDKKEWYRKHWTLKDPTPTTEKNEALEEFEKRVLHSKAYFGELIDYKHIKYLRDQDLRDNWFHAPWDARGELYIKYGEPSFSSIAGFRKVEWSYTSHNVDFIINKHMTNIYGNAISPGPISRFNYRFNLMEIEARYINNSEFKYNHNYEKEPIDGAEVYIKNKTIKYSIPQDEIASSDEGTKSFQQTYVIYDDDMRIILRNESTQSVVDKQTIQQTIPFNLDPGQYMLALRIEDLNSDKLGIFMETFSIDD